MSAFHGLVSVAVLALSIGSILKFLFFFALPYRSRRAALDKSYDGRAYASSIADRVLLLIAVLLAAALLAGGAEPISFLGGLFVGATLIQLFFHAFHVTPPADREAPEPRSPLKRLSYAIQDQPARAWKEMAAYTVIVIAGIVLHLIR